MSTLDDRIREHIYGRRCELIFAWRERHHGRAAQVISDAIEAEIAHLSTLAPIARVMAITARRTGVSVTDMKSARRTKSLVAARQVAMYVARMVSQSSYPEIGRRFGNRDHTTVMHAVRKIERLASEREDIARLVTTIRWEWERAARAAAYRRRPY